MANADAGMPKAAASHKSRLKGVIIGAVLAALLGGSTFYMTWSGLLFASREDVAGANSPTVPGLPDIAFVPIAPFLVSLGPDSTVRHLRFQAQLEVNKSQATDVTLLLPRVVDVLNGYLRAIEPAELEEPGALTRLRAQMLRRVQIVVGEGRVRDLLIMEFVLN